MDNLQLEKMDIKTFEILEKQVKKDVNSIMIENVKLGSDFKNIHKYLHADYKLSIFDQTISALDFIL